MAKQKAGINAGNIASRIRSIERRSNILIVIVIVLAAVIVYQSIMINSLLGSSYNAQQMINKLDTALTKISQNGTTTSANTSLLMVKSYNITGQAFLPPSNLSDYPVITQQQKFGSRLTSINMPLNSTELSIINNAPDSYFEIAGEMFLNGTIGGIVASPVQSSEVNQFILNGKPSVIYFGSITCVFCGENRWAMALALGRFGKFGSLYKGYSSFGDYDLPTLYWRPAEYGNTTVNIGDFYNSSYINFIAIEDSAPITGGFSLQPLSTIQSEINKTNNIPYMDAFNFILRLNQFTGTPYTIWGSYQVGGADALDFGNSSNVTTPFPLTNMTHDQVLQQLSNPTDQFALREYAAADIYIALTCASIGNTAPVCSLPAISQIETRIGAG